MFVNMHVCICVCIWREVFIFKSIFGFSYTCVVLSLFIGGSDLKNK